MTVNKLVMTGPYLYVYYLKDDYQTGEASFLFAETTFTITPIFAGDMINETGRQKKISR